MTVDALPQGYLLLSAILQDMLMAPGLLCRILLGPWSSLDLLIISIGQILGDIHSTYRPARRS